jgi:type I restriction enzyme S subunit
MDQSKLQNNDLLKTLSQKWDIRSFAEVIEDTTKSHEKILTSDYMPKGLLPVIDQGQSYIAGYIDDYSKAYKNNLPVIIFGDHTRCFKYIDFNFALGADGIKVLSPKVDIHMKYLYYFFQSVNIPNTGYNRHFKYLKELQIPLPPLSEQKKIAAVLDKADQLRQKRKEAIEKLDRLVHSVFLDMFGDPVTNPKGWEIIAFGELIDVLTDYHANGSYEILREHVELLDNEDYALMVRTTDLENVNFTK